MLLYDLHYGLGSVVVSSGMNDVRAYMVVATRYVPQLICATVSIFG